MREESAVRILLFTAQGWRETATLGKWLPHTFNPLTGCAFLPFNYFQ